MSVMKNYKKPMDKQLCHTVQQQDMYMTFKARQKMENTNLQLDNHSVTTKTQWHNCDSTAGN